MSTRKTNIVVPSHRNDQTRTARFSSNRARIMINITQAVIDNHLSNSSPRCLQPVSRRQSRRHDRHGSRRSAANPHGTSSTRETKSAFVRVCALVNWSVYLRWNGDGSASGRSPWKIRFPQSLPGLPEGNKYGGALPLELRWLHLVVAVSYQKINTPVAHQYRGFFLETRSHPLRNDIFRGTIGLYRENTVWIEVDPLSRFISAVSLPLCLDRSFDGGLYSSLSLSLPLFLRSTVGKSGLNGNRKIRFPDPVNPASTSAIVPIVASVYHCFSFCFFFSLSLFLSFRSWSIARGKMLFFRWILVLVFGRTSRSAAWRIEVTEGGAMIDRSIFLVFQSLWFRMDGIETAD